MRDYLLELRTIEAEIASLNSERSSLYKAARLDGVDVQALKHGHLAAIDYPRKATRKPEATGFPGPMLVRRPSLGALTLVTSPRDDRSQVYFAICGPLGLLKVGISINVDRRLSAFRQSPTPLACWFVFPGGREVESACHRALANWRVRGEWFALNDFTIKLSKDLAARFGLSGVADPAMPSLTCAHAETA